MLRSEVATTLHACCAPHQPSVNARYACRLLLHPPRKTTHKPLTIIHPIPLLSPPLHNPRRPRGFGFIEFRDQRDAEEAMFQLNGSTVGGREISVCGRAHREGAQGGCGTGVSLHAARAEAAAVCFCGSGNLDLRWRGPAAVWCLTGGVPASPCHLHCRALPTLHPQRPYPAAHPHTPRW